MTLRISSWRRFRTAPALRCFNEAAAMTLRISARPVRRDLQPRSFNEAAAMTLRISGSACSRLTSPTMLQ